ncbi:MAG: binding-protein-dependent transport system inner rane component, partial [Frankiales bacterium]|nr:binding-protein-dependent transport system inner rane component [Frankiales bacterium]
MSIDDRVAPVAALPLDAAAVAAVRPRRRPDGRRVLYGLLGLLLAAALWQVVSLVKADPVILPSLPATLRTAYDHLTRTYPAVQGRTLIGHALVSGGRILAGWAAGVALGVVVGGLM